MSEEKPQSTGESAQPEKDVQELRHSRDGTSQAGRLLPALDPAYVSVDERRTRDLLAFAKDYAKELNYFQANGTGIEASGDWSAFLSDDIDLDELAACVDELQTMSAETVEKYARPHLVLFLTFLKLLRHTQDQLNTFTKRHLDFYYQQVLKMTKKRGVPDQVHVLINLVPGASQVLLPKGTSLNAGDDSQGNGLVYRTDEDIVANRAQVARLCSVYVDKQEKQHNFYTATDATSVQGRSSFESGADSPHWRTFGQRPPEADRSSVPQAEIGWAVSSPILSLSQGHRHISLTLGFDREQFDGERIRTLLRESNHKAEVLPFLIQISTEKGWVEPTSMEIEVPENNQASEKAAGSENEKLETIQMTLCFDESVNPIVAPSAMPGQPSGLWPVLKVTLRQIWQPSRLSVRTGRYITHYLAFKQLILRRVHLDVAVQGLSPSHLQNDESKLKVGSPFEPFGCRPMVGSRLLIGHPELVQKKLSSLDVQFEWMGLPRSWKTYYENYTDENHTAPSKSEAFTTRISLSNKRTELVLDDTASLFDKKKPESAINVDVAAITKDKEYERILQEVFPEDLSNWERCLQLELNAPDFQHEVYPALAAKKSVALATAIANKKNDDIDAARFQLNPPYTPKTKQLELCYKSSLEIDLEAESSSARVDRVMHLEPFGFREIKSTPTEPAFFLPQFDFEGELYIGLENVNAPQNLSLLFQLAEGTANPDLEPTPIQWSYLSQDRWLSLEDGRLLEDATRGLINSGLIKFALESAQPGTRLPGELYWLRAAIPKNSGAVCDTVAIHTQAVSATFFDQGNATDHLGRPLPAQSITDLSVTKPDIAGVEQPYTSYGGKMAEGDKTFYTRISERLRHKDRTLTSWDYEHQVLEHFPEIYKVKCLPASRNRLGVVELIVIPDIQGKLPFNPYEPKAPADLLANIEAYLRARSSPFTRLNVRNARYITIMVRVAVHFLPGHNEGFYRRQLNEELSRFLSPWAYEEGADIVIGNRIHANSIVNFIDERPYVDYVAKIKLFTSEGGKQFSYVLPRQYGEYWVETDLPDGVMVAAQEHQIDIISDAGYKKEQFDGIGYMKIELDFVVG